MENKRFGDKRNEKQVRVDSDLTLESNMRNLSVKLMVKNTMDHVFSIKMCVLGVSNQTTMPPTVLEIK